MKLAVQMGPEYHLFRRLAHGEKCWRAVERVLSGEPLEVRTIPEPHPGWKDRASYEVVNAPPTPRSRKTVTYVGSPQLGDYRSGHSEEKSLEYARRDSRLTLLRLLESAYGHGHGMVGSHLMPVLERLHPGFAEAYDRRLQELAGR